MANTFEERPATKRIGPSSSHTGSTARPAALKPLTPPPERDQPRSAETTGIPASEIFEFLETHLAAWLTEQEGTLAEIEIVALAPLIERVVWLTLPDGTRKSVSLPSKIGFATSDLRRAQADPERGTWNTAHL